jgi:SAM-dependent methyltransferase
VHLVLLSCGALLCHTALSESRPDPRHLTEFYFWIALGGVLGGVFAAIIAPLIFKTVLEYPLLVALLPLFRQGKFKRDNWLIPLLFAAAVLSGWAVFRTTGVYAHPEAFAVAHIAAVFICYIFERHTLRFALCFALLMMVYSLTLRSSIEGANRIYAGRNFFGVKKVLDDPETHLRRLMHGDTLHGVESTDPVRMGKPLSYYHPTGPVGDVIHVMQERGGFQHFGVIGLGSGSMAAYADSNHPVTFYEIDPSIEQVARRFFTFLKQCGANCNILIGDGRLQLAQSADGSFDLLMLDAFSSDSIAAHLLSREAFQLYISKLAPGGVLLFHVSNRYLKVEQLVSAQATDAGLVAFSRSDATGDLNKEGKVGSDHVIAARRIEDLGSLPGMSGWKPVTRSVNLRPWTDDYSNLLDLVRWR